MIASYRLYKNVGNDLKELIKTANYVVGDKLPPERDIADLYGVSRTVVREAIIMLELEDIVRVKKGSGVYIINLPDTVNGSHSSDDEDDFGPFELLPARQLIESNIASFAASQVVKSDITELRTLLNREREMVAQGNLDDYSVDEQFHIALAKATKNSVLENMLTELWQKRNNSQMWQKLHTHITDHSYRKIWLEDHEQIIQALQTKDPAAAKQAVWQHLENVKNVLMRLSNNEDPDFDGYLFESIPCE